MPEMSVIIVNWNGRHMLADCLGALCRQTFLDFETILVDNGSSDGSAEYIRDEFPEVKLIQLPENRGFTGGNTAGYQQAQGDLIVLLNNDTEAHPEWLEEVHKASLLYPGAGSFASKMMYFDNRTRIENCGFDVGLAGTTVDLGRDEPEGPQWSAARTVFGACGGAVAYRRKMLEDVGFLDADFFMVYEDLDLSFRAQLRGYTCVYVPTAMVFHRYRATLGARTDRQVYYSQRNIEFVYFKNMPAGLMLLAAPHRLLYEIGAAIYFIRQGTGVTFLRAKFDALRHLPKLWRKRRQIQRGKVLRDDQLHGLLKATLSFKWKKLLSSWS